MSENLKVISPIDGSVYYECAMHNQEDINTALVSAEKAQAEWRECPISERIEFINKFIKR